MARIINNQQGDDLDLATLAGLLNNQPPGSFTIDHEVGRYEVWDVVTTYTWDEGLAQMPVAQDAAKDSEGAPSPREDRPACEVVRHSAPTGQKLVTWTARRVGRPPAVPHPTVFADDNSTFLGSKIDVHAPKLQLALNRVFEAKGVYTYALLRPVWCEDGLAAGATPYDTTKKADNVYPKEMFRQELAPGGEAEDQPRGALPRANRP